MSVRSNKRALIQIRRGVVLREAMRSSGKKNRKKKKKTRSTLFCRFFFFFVLLTTVQRPPRLCSHLCTRRLNPTRGSEGVHCRISLQNRAVDIRQIVGS